MSYWSVGALLLCVIALGIGLNVRRRRARDAVLQTLQAVKETLNLPMPVTLVSRQAQLTRSLQQLQQQVESGRLPPEKGLEPLPRIELQIHRLLQDHARYDRVDEVQKQLQTFLARLENAPQGSELADLNLIARNAYRLAHAQLEEGELETARATALEALKLLDIQLKELETARSQLPELANKVKELEQLALDCSAPILLRAPWEQLKGARADLERAVQEQRHLEAVHLASSLIPQLENIHRELADRIGTQLDDARSKTRDRLEPLLSWPPDAWHLREEVAKVLQSCEKPPSKRRSLQDVWKGLELARSTLERATALSLEHTRRWQARQETLQLRLQTNLVNERLRTYRSLPPPLVEEGRALRRLRLRLETARDGRAPWEACADIEQLLEREAELVQHAESLHTQIRTRLEKAGQTLQELPSSAEPGLVDELRRTQVRQSLELSREALTRLELAELEFSLVALESSLQQLCHDAALKALKRGREWQRRLRETLEALTRDDLQLFVKDEAVRLTKALSTLDALLEKEPSSEATFTTSVSRGFAMLKAAGTLGVNGTELIVLARKRRFQLRLKGALDQPGGREELAGLPDEQRIPLSEEARTLHNKLRVLEQAVQKLLPDRSDDPGADLERVEAPGLDQSQRALDALESTLTQVEADVRWLLLRIRKELHKQVVEAVDQLKRWKQGLSSGQIRFYLPEGTGDALALLPGLEARAAQLSSLSPPEVLKLQRELQEVNARLEALWSVALPKARKYYERQLARLDAELLQTSLEGLPASLVERSRGHHQALDALRSSLTEGAFERFMGSLTALEAQIQAFGETASRFRSFGSYWEGQQERRQALEEQLRSAGCHVELVALRQSSERLEQALSASSSQDLLELEQAWSAAMKAGQSALTRASEELLQTRKEQEAVRGWESRLNGRKQELDWLRTCVKDILVSGAEGLNLKEGLAILQTNKRALEPINLDLELAARQDEQFKKWLKGVLTRAEKQFRIDFREVIESLHEQPVSAKGLCAEVLAHIDAVLGSQYADEAERARYLSLQKRGDAYHRLFGKKLLP